MNLYQDAKFASLIRCISEERLTPYCNSEEKSLEPALARYAWNIALCEALYPALNLVEVVLRNNLHASLVAQYGEKWYDLPGILREPELRQIETAKGKIIKEKKSCSPGRILSELSFGFWVTLLGRHYEQKIFHRLAHAVFPNMPAALRSRKYIGPRLHKIRFSLRNRAFHHEPIWKNPKLLQYHDDLLEAIAWLSTDAHVLVLALDRFKSVYQAGYQTFIEKTKSLCVERNK